MKSIITILLMLTVVFAQDSMPANLDAGGIKPCIASCCIGPRVGLEMNEGMPVQTEEWIYVGSQFLASVHYIIPTAGQLYMAYMLGYTTNGVEGALASYFLGPRVGQEYGERKIRTKEWLGYST